MTWDWATVTLVLSGAAIVAFALLVDEDSALVKRQKGDLLGGRSMFVGLGLAAIAYGVFVGLQDSGTWVVPGLLPVFVLLLLGYLVFEKVRSSG
jgi:hypothetical protein